MTTYFLIIKGDQSQAVKAAADRGIALADETLGAPSGKTNVMTLADPFGNSSGKADASVDKLIKWFCETNNPAPFPVGTLLFYQKLERPTGAFNDPIPYSDKAFIKSFKPIAR